MKYTREKVEDVVKYGIDTSHFLGRRTNCGEAHSGGPKRKSAQEILVLNKPGSLTHKAFQIRRALIEPVEPPILESTGRSKV
jgi:hypothetical protein